MQKISGILFKFSLSLSAAAFLHRRVTFELLRIAFFLMHQKNSGIILSEWNKLINPDIFRDKKILIKKCITNQINNKTFLALPVHDTANTPQAILNWPGAGNIYARGNDNATLILYAGRSYAPFVDLNGNGIYEPLLGEYPDIPGDQALWWIFSDNGPTHNCTNGRPLGVEIQAMAYAYSRGSLIDNVVYYKYHITNYSANTYNKFRVGQWAQPQIGSSYYLTNFGLMDKINGGIR